MSTQETTAQVHHVPDKLRIGLLVDDDTVPYWVRLIIERLNASSSADIVLVAINTASAVPPASMPRKILRNADRLLYIGWSLLDRALKRFNPDYDEDHHWRQLVPGATVLPVQPRQTRFSDFVEADDIQVIAEHQLDILLRFGFRILRGDILTTPKHGVWSFHHGDNQRMRGGPAGVWDLLLGEDSQGVILQRLNEDLDGGMVIDRGWYGTDIWSLHRQNHQVFMQAWNMLPRNIDALHQLGAETFFRRLQEQQRGLEFYSRPMRVAPGNLTAVKLLSGHAWRYLSEKLQLLFMQRQWVLLVSKPGSLEPTRSMWRLNEIIPPADRIWADPFVVSRDGVHTIFIEEKTNARRDGFISVMQINAQGVATRPKSIIERPYHMSYPFVFEYQQQWYMVPETANGNVIEVYRCEQFPDRWEHSHHLLENIEAYDTTLLEYQGRWWLFALVNTNKHLREISSELHIFHADNPLATDWQPHPRNPVVTDIRSARPAGRFFEFNGKLYRPSQNCGVRYGYGMKFNRVVELTTENYEECCEDEVLPNWDWRVCATHTYNVDNTFTVSDALRYRFRWDTSATPLADAQDQKRED